MSRSQTPPSISSSSSSSRSSYRKLGSDTTPSPSGGSKSPVFNPRALSNRLALVEASQALSHASKTLSIAAHAMSKAAASLAAVSGYDYEGYTLGEGDSEDIGDWAGSPDWTKRTYDLSLPTTSGDNGIYAGDDQGDKLTEVDRALTSEVLTSSNIQPECDAAPSHVSGENENVYLSPSTPTTYVEAQPSTPQVGTTQGPPVELTEPSSSITPSNTIEWFFPATPVDAEVNSSLDEDLTNEPDSGQSDSEPEGHSMAPTPVPTLPRSPTESYHGTSSLLSSQPVGSTYIVLKHGFDVLPALCYIVKRHTKVVCLYNYAGLPAATQTASMLRANVTLPVTVPESGKQNILAATARKFNSVRSGILLWPGCKALPKINGLADSTNVQLIHLGEPNHLNDGIICSRTTTILSRSDMRNRQSHHKIDTLNSLCNQQGPESPLHPFRVWLRARLTKDNYARGFYLDWILQRRKQNLGENVVEIVRLANQYAGEFLLRGKGRKHGEPVGGQITIPKSSLKGQKLDAAVDAGVLLVS